MGSTLACTTVQEAGSVGLGTIKLVGRDRRRGCFWTIQTEIDLEHPVYQAMTLPSEGLKLFDAAHKSAQHTLASTFTSHEVREPSRINASKFENLKYRLADIVYGIEAEYQERQTVRKLGVRLLRNRQYLKQTSTRPIVFQRGTHSLYLHGALSQ